MATDRNDDELNANLAHWLRRLKPAKVRSVDSSDEPTIIAVPGGRVRWTFVIENIHARAWQRLEALNKGGDIIGVFENPDQGAQPAAASTAIERVGNDERMLSMMLRAQEVALKYRDQEHKQLLGSMAEMLKVNVEATRQLQQIYAAQVEAAGEVAALQATAQGGGSIEDLLKAAPHLMPILGMLFGKRPMMPSPNGVG